MNEIPVGHEPSIVESPPRSIFTPSMIATRDQELATRMADLIRRFSPHPVRALDVGAQRGVIAVRLAELTGAEFAGVEPFLRHDSEQHGGVRIARAFADKMPFEDETFDVVTLLSVYEHIVPDKRRRSLWEIHRILKPGGILVGQLPNMYYPIEPHSMLPFQSYLPTKVGEKYYKRFQKTHSERMPVSWYRVGLSQLKNDASAVGLRDLYVLRSLYSIDVLPYRFRWLYPLSRAFPPSFDFVFKRTA